MMIGELFIHGGELQRRVYVGVIRAKAHAVYN